MALPVSAEVKRTANISVAVATLDRPEDLACCLEAILNGEVLPAELIVVDQSKSQSAQPVAARIQGAGCPVRYIYQQKRGLSASRNAAVENAACPYIAFTDDDCVPDAFWLASLERAFGTAPLPAAVSGRVLPYGPESAELYSVSPRESKVRADFTGKQIPWKVGTGGNFAVEMNRLRQVGRFDERLGAGTPGKAAEDADMIFRLLRSGARIRYEPEALIFHRRQSIAKRMSSRWNYGFGIGVFCALWLRKLELYSLYLFASWLFIIMRELLGLTMRRQRQEVQQRAQSLRGTLKGFFYGIGISPKG